MSEEYYSVSAYAKLVGKTTMTIYNRIKSGKLDYIEAEIGNGNKKGYFIKVDKNKEE